MFNLQYAVATHNAAAAHAAAAATGDAVEAGFVAAAATAGTTSCYAQAEDSKHKNR